MPEAPAVPQPKSGLRIEDFEGELVILDRDTGDLHHLDRNASLVWAAIDGQRNAREIVDALEGLVRAERAQLSADVTIALIQLRSVGLVSDAAGGDDGPRGRRDG